MRSWLAQKLVARGLEVALPSYSLCPDVSVMDIVGELRLFLAALWKKTGKHPLVTGHSAGGHLTAAMIRANTRLPIDTVGDVYSLMACNDVGCQRLVEMMDEFHLENLDTLAEHICSKSREAVLAEIANLPKGSWSHSMALGHQFLSEIGGDPFRAAVEPRRDAFH